MGAEVPAGGVPPGLLFAVSCTPPTTPKRRKNGGETGGEGDNTGGGIPREILTVSPGDSAAEFWQDVGKNCEALVEGCEETLSVAKEAVSKFTSTWGRAWQEVVVGSKQGELNEYNFLT